MEGLNLVVLNPSCLKPYLDKAFSIEGSNAKTPIDPVTESGDAQISSAFADIQ